MKQVYIASDMIDAELFKDFLLSKSIPAEVKGAMLVGIIGEIPANTYPTVWVVEDRDFDLARKCVDEYENRVNVIAQMCNWMCNKCGEENEPQFQLCWSCGQQQQ